MLKKFEIGKYYRWIGPQDYSTNWNSRMEAWKDGEPRRCTDEYECMGKNTTRYIFDDIGCGKEEYYYGDCMEYFEEVDMKSSELKIKMSIDKMEKELASMKEQLANLDKIVFDKNKYYVVKSYFSNNKFILQYFYQDEEYMFAAIDGWGKDGGFKTAQKALLALDERDELHVFDSRTEAYEFFNKKG